MTRARALIAARNLPMYAATMQLNLAGEEATCHFQSDRHVDFTPVVREVEEEFDVRLHMQQAGPRDRAKLVDGHDICGLRLCCSSWMTDFPKVGIRMAKEQSLALNPDKLSGVCGRLLCCLTFEYPVYREMRGTLPKLGKRVSTPAGMGKVVQTNVLKQTIAVELDDRVGRVEVPVAELGMAVRVEEEPNAALEETLSDVLGRPPTTAPAAATEPTAPAAAIEPTAPAAATEPTAPAERPAGQPVRRGGRPPRGGGRAARPVDGGSAAPADPAAAAGEERPGRRRRRRGGRRRGRGRAEGGDAAPGGQPPPAAGATDERASGPPASGADAGATADADSGRRRRGRRWAGRPATQAAPPAWRATAGGPGRLRWRRRWRRPGRIDALGPQ